MSPWLLSAIALVGALYLAARRPIEAQVIWLVSNLGWAAVAFKRHDWPLGVFFLGMLAVTLYGLASWIRDYRSYPRRPGS